MIRKEQLTFDNKKFNLISSSGVIRPLIKRLEVRFEVIIRAPMSIGVQISIHFKK